MREPPIANLCVVPDSARNGRNLKQAFFPRSFLKAFSETKHKQIKKAEAFREHAENTQALCKCR